MDPESVASIRGPQIAIFPDRHTWDTETMSQHAYARAIALLEDNGVDPDTARYIMKRLHDYGYAATARDTGPGASPPVAGSMPAEDARARIRAEVAAARERAEAERQAGIAAEKAAREAEDAARNRQLAVARVLATMPG